MRDLLKRWFEPDAYRVEQYLKTKAAALVSTRKVVRDGIEYVFEEYKTGEMIVRATTQTRPIRGGVFELMDLPKAVAWREFGEVPSNETADKLRQLRAGTWPPPWVPEEHQDYP